MVRSKSIVGCGAVFISLFFFFMVFPHTPAHSEESLKSRADRFLDRIDDMWRGKSSHGIFTMQVKTRHYTRTMKMEAWSMGKEKTLVRILLPKKERGTATLKSGNSIYTYLPKTDRTIRLTSGMMMGSWMGSHFTNDDLVKESRLSDDYDSEITFEGKRGGIAIIEITLNPKPEAAVVWGKVVLEIRAVDKIPLKEVFYDEDGALVRTMTFSDVKMLGGRKVPALLRITPEDKPDEYTEVVYLEMRYNLKLNDSIFSISQLRKM